MKRFTLRVLDPDTGNIKNIQHSNEDYTLMEMEKNIKKDNPSLEVWICDNLQEVLVG